ncbi:MAG TPA: GNAT family N-acetyltransferase [Dermatophilaceae bacterium]|nr:GNAT family N-acetyltransferase [Dermatophilaceae bacterium]
MDTVTVRVLGVQDWQSYRDAWLRSLRDAPEAFSSEHDTEARLDEQVWLERMRRSVRLLAEEDGTVVGIVSVNDQVDLLENAVEVFGLWVAEPARGHGVAQQLMQAATQVAVRAGKRQVVTWVGTDNGPAVAFVSGYGFRPTEYRRQMQSVPVRGLLDDAPNPPLPAADDDLGDVEFEMAMILALGH